MYRWVCGPTCSRIMRACSVTMVPRTKSGQNPGRYCDGSVKPGVAGAGGGASC